MVKDKKLVAFNNKKIRRLWDEEQEKWYFSVIDIVSALTDSDKPRDYWYHMKQREHEASGIELSTFCRQLKLESADGKKYETDCADTESVFRIIQSIPSSKAEPFKLWLARVGYERVEEVADPELAINRAIQHYLRQGRTRDWIDLRLKSIEIRKILTNEWEDRGVTAGDQFAVLTDDITFAWASMTTKRYKKHKNLKKEGLRDNMTNIELVLNMLGEAATTEISKKEMPVTFPKNRVVAKKGGEVAGVARKQLEKRLGRSVISKQNYLQSSQKRIKGG